MMVRTLLPVSLLLMVALGSRAASPELDQQAYNAVLAKDGKKTAALLAKGANANHVVSGRSLLGWAAQGGDTGTVQALINAKADLNFVDGIGHTPLMRAVELGHARVGEVLLAAKPKLDVPDQDGQTAAMRAVESGNVEMVKQLLKAGADFNRMTEEGISAAILVSQHSDPAYIEIVGLLSAHKVDLNAGNHGGTPLLYALELEKPTMLEALLKAGANPDLPGKNGEIPLSKALSTPEFLKVLLRGKANPNIVNSDGWPVLFEAIETGEIETVRALLVAGAKPSAADRNGRTAIDFATEQNRTAIVALLKKHAATPARS